MRYFFKLDSNSIILDAKASNSSLTGWTEVSEINYLTVINMLNNPNSVVNNENGFPEYVNGKVGVVVIHPSNGLLPPAIPESHKVVTIFGTNGEILSETVQEKTIFELRQEAYMFGKPLP